MAAGMVRSVCASSPHQGDEKLDTGAGLEPADVYATKNRWLVWPLLALQLLVAKPLLCRQIRNDPDYN